MFRRQGASYQAAGLEWVKRLDAVRELPRAVGTIGLGIEYRGVWSSDEHQTTVSQACTTVGGTLSAVETHHSLPTGAELAARQQMCCAAYERLTARRCRALRPNMPFVVSNPSNDFISRSQCKGQGPCCRAPSGRSMVALSRHVSPSSSLRWIAPTSLPSPASKPPEPTQRTQP